MFEASEHHAFENLVQSARMIITTSISEGFGFSFLEPWTAGQMLSGRCLSDICSNFINKQMKLDHLYDRFKIPLDHIDQMQFFDQWKTCIRENAGVFKISVSDKAIARAYERMTSGKIMDFCLMDEHFQKQVIKGILTDKKFKYQIIAHNPFLSDFTQMPDSSDIINHNRAIVETEFSRNKYRTQLLQAYKNVIHQPVSHQIDKKVLAESFLNLKNFSLLKWCDHEV
jgi:hypothetical protein